jgi:hypothetical protein
MDHVNTHFGGLGMVQKKPFRLRKWGIGVVGEVTAIVQEGVHG